VKRGIRPDNPARGVKKPPVRTLERFLSEEEIARLAGALDDEAQATGSPNAATAIKLLLLAGCRRGEILGLKWQHVDFERRCLRLPDSKTGAKVVYLNAPALALLQELPRVEGNPHVIAGATKGGPLSGIDKVWFRVRKKAGLIDVRLHDLRHSFASVGAIGGLSLPVIGALLGHKHAATTARYAHLSADPVRAANEAVGARIAAAMAKQEGQAAPKAPADGISTKITAAMAAAAEVVPLKQTA
jgi:integrase